VRASHAIQRIGFRKWYERELLRSHANLVLLLLATLGLLGCAEAYRRSAPLMDQLQVMACAVASAAIAILALRRYLYRLKHAEHVAGQAVCAQCDTYARFETTDVSDGGTRLQVRCRKCAHRWDIDV
jgi:hypothetical protein